MPRGRQTGIKNRNYPPLPLEDALRVPRAIEDQASGMKVSRLTLAELLDSTPTSRVFKELVAASRFYGLSNGGINAEEFSLTELGSSACGGDEVEQDRARKAAVMNVGPFRAFFEKFNSKKMPAVSAFKEFLVRDADVEANRADECIDHIMSDAKTAGLTRTMKSGEWIDLSGTPASPPQDVEDEDGDGEGDDEEVDALDKVDPPLEDEAALGTARSRQAPKKVFIAHGKNRVPLDQLKRTLDQFKVKYAVAVDEPNQGRPISKKVADLMEKECSSGIFIFTADEKFLREKDGATEEVWRPSENVVFELGAASILYDNRIVIFKEKDVTFPSDFSDLGYIEFEKDQLVAEMGNLFSELVSLDILEVRAKG
jgi:predicted nucleotide-binding protein